MGIEGGAGVSHYEVYEWGLGASIAGLALIVMWAAEWWKEKRGKKR